MSDEEFMKHAQEQVNDLERRGFWLGMKPRATTICTCYPVLDDVGESHAESCPKWVAYWRRKAAVKDMTNA